MISNTAWLPEVQNLNPPSLFEQWLQDEQLRDFIEVNEYNQVLWFNQEKFEGLALVHAVASVLWLCISDRGKRG